MQLNTADDLSMVAAASECPDMSKVAVTSHRPPTPQLLQPLCSWIGWPLRWQVDLEAKLMSDMGADSGNSLLVASHFEPRPSKRWLRV